MNKIKVNLVNWLYNITTFAEYKIYHDCNGTIKFLKRLPATSHYFMIHDHNRQNVNLQPCKLLFLLIPIHPFLPLHTLGARAQKMFIFLIFQSKTQSSRNWVFNKGYCTPNQKLECFVLYLKIINTFWKKWYMHLKANCPGNSNNGIKILVNQVVFKFWIQTVKILFWSVTQELLILPTF